MKLKLSYVISLILLIASTANAGNRAVEIDIGGIGPGVDAAAFDTVKQVVGHAVATGTVDKFIVRNYGIEGGFSACAQASPGSKTFGSFVKQLGSIKPNRNTTAYAVRPVAACTDEVVFCTQEVKLCPDGKTYVGRIGPSCEFAPCPGL
jgi:hypothetical protein